MVRSVSDYVAELADVSTGSVGSPDGWSTVITRGTDAGIQYSNRQLRQDFETKPIEEVKPGLGLLGETRCPEEGESRKEHRARKEMGLPTPLLIPSITFYF